MRTRSHRARRFAASITVLLLAMGGVVAQNVGTASANDGGPHGRRHSTLYVSPSASASKRGRSCESARFATIQSAVNAASSGATVVVCPGVYHEQVVVQKPLSLVGLRATIDQQGVTPTFVLPPPVGPLQIFAGVVITSSHVSFAGFTVRNASGEGILAATVPPNNPTKDVSIRNNQVVHNDLGGGNPPASTYFECQPAGEVPGDCGEGVHFIGVAYSTVSRNFISDNSGGILLTDETGPTHDNFIAGNVVTRNQFDCGITVPGHNPDALDASGNRQPSVAGVYRNAIVGNVITDNGHLGEGAGVLFANASGGTASYDNVVEHNYIAGNQLAGVTMHAHLLNPATDPNASKGEDLNGNRIVENAIGTNNVPGQFVQGDDLDGVVTVNRTTGVLVWAGPVSVRVTIADNRISDDHFGIWLGKTANVVADLRHNSFHDVDVPLQLFS